MRKRVVITGLGAITAFGEGISPFWDAWISGRSALETLDFGSWKVNGAYLKSFDAERYISNRKSIKVMARDIQLAVAAAKLAIDDSGISIPVSDPNRAGICVGAGVLNHELDELASSMRNAFDESGRVSLQKFGEEGVGRLFPLWLLKYLPNMPACHITIGFDLRGPSNTITTGASSSLQAVEEACRIIERGSADWMLAGGAESKINPVGIAQYASENALAKSNSDPKKIYRPLDQHAAGFVPGEAAAFLGLEELEHAQKRGAPIYAEIAGYGSSSSDGQKEALSSALDHAKIRPQDIHYIQASALGLPADDQLEIEAMNHIFKNQSEPIWVSGTKPVAGFMGSASGAVDLAALALSMREQKIGPLLNFEKTKDHFPFKVARTVVSAPIQYALSTAFGFNGQACCIALKKFKGISS